MAFTIELSHEECDKCHRSSSDPENPVIRLAETRRSDRHIIFIHLYCFDAKVAQLQKKAALASPKLDDSRPEIINQKTGESVTLTDKLADQIAKEE